MKCAECDWDYPIDYLHAIHSSEDDIDGKVICGICALDLSNSISTIKRTKFSGTVAESMRQKAVKWRERFRIS
jgi:hypothetical protein